MHIIHEKSYKNLDYRKVVTRLYNSFSNQWFIAEKTAIKKWDLMKTPCKSNEWKLNCDDKQKKRRSYNSSSSWKKMK